MIGQHAIRTVSGYAIGMGITPALLGQSQRRSLALAGNQRRRRISEVSQVRDQLQACLGILVGSPAPIRLFAGAAGYRHSRPCPASVRRLPANAAWRGDQRQAQPGLARNRCAVPQGMHRSFRLFRCRAVSQLWQCGSRRARTRPESAGPEHASAQAAAFCDSDAPTICAALPALCCSACWRHAAWTLLLREIGLSTLIGKRPEARDQSRASDRRPRPLTASLI